MSRNESKESESPRPSHVDERGRARMVDVGDKAVTSRRAVARGRVRLPAAAFQAVKDNSLEKGDVMAVARLAGICGAKETSRLIPLCHQVELSVVSVDLDLDEAESCVVITASARTEARTGIEMEALTAVSIAALAIYDTCKSVSKGIVIEEILLLRKEGGRSGLWELES